MNENFNIMISLANQFEVDLRLQKLTELATKKKSIPMDKEANEHSRKYTYSINRSRVHVRYMAEK